MLGGIADYAAQQIQPGLDLAHTEARQITTRRRVKKSQDLTAEASRLLRIAWQHELAARLAEMIDDPTVRRVVAQTLPMQSYYALFNAARALTCTSGSPATNHSSVHGDFESRRVREAAGPWAVTLSGDPQHVTDCKLDPPLCQLTGFNPLESGREPVEYLAAALRTTRKSRSRPAAMRG